MTDTLDRRRSATRDDFIQASPQTTGGVWFWQVMDPGSLSTPEPSLPARTPYTWNADALLAATLDLEDMWAGVINQAATKIAVRGWEISDSDDSERKTRKAQDLVVNLDGAAEYRSGMNKLLQDFLLTRNGCFMEIERESKSPKSRPRALWHLDSLRCRRTGNLEYPVVYWDMQGHFHALRNDQVIFFADMPSPRANLYGVGRPAAERAFKTIVKLAAVETYFREKITGARALKLVFISGVTKKKLQDVKETSDLEQERRGWTVYKGAVMVPTETDAAINIAEVDLAGVPDGFDVEQERRDAYLRYANCIGVPVQDVQPLSGQGLGTGTQTVILDENAEGRGIAYFPRVFEDKVNWLLMPKTTTFDMKTNDIRDRQAEAALAQVRVATLIAAMGTAQAPGFISKEQALNTAVDEGLFPKEYLPKDITPEGTVTDSGEQSKPAGGQDTPALLQQTIAQLTTKDDEAFDRLLASPESQAWLAREAEQALKAEDDDDWQAALTWAKEAQARAD